MLAPPRGVHLPQLLAQRAVPRGAAAAKGRRVSEQRLAGRVREGSSKVPRGNGADGSGASISASVSSAGRRSASVRSAACGSPPAQNLPPRAVRLNGPREGLAWLIRARGVWMRRDESKSELLETHLRRRGAQAEQTDARDERRLRWPLSIVAGGGRRRVGGSESSCCCPLFTTCSGCWRCRSAAATRHAAERCGASCRGGRGELAAPWAGGCCRHLRRRRATRRRALDARDRTQPRGQGRARSPGRAEATASGACRAWDGERSREPARVLPPATRNRDGWPSY